MKNIIVNNMPDWAWNKLCVTARRVDGAWWFYDAWDNDGRACDQACDEGLTVFYIDQVKEM